MKAKEKIIFIVTALIAFCSLIYLVRSVLAPFVCSLLIAYFLDPLVDRMGKKYKLSRLAATSAIIGLFFAVLISLCLLLLPIIYIQSVALIDALPQYIKTFSNDLYPRIASALNKFGFKLESELSNSSIYEQVSEKLGNFSKDIFSNLLTSSATLINALSLIFITPILVFYLLKDWDILIKKIHDHLPQAVSTSSQKIASEIDKALSGYMRGQINVCLILGVIYSALLSFTGLNFGFLIGFLTGLLSFIPYVGMLSGISFAVVVGLFQWGFDLTNISSVALVFLFGQLIESNFLTPKLIGKKIGLHPVWMIFGLFFFGTLFGFIGILTAVPLTAICGTIIKHVSAEYKKFSS